MLFSGAGCNSLVLANPWTFEDDTPAHGPPPEAIRARYADKLRNPREIMRLMSGGVSLTKLGKGIARAMRPPPPPTSLLRDMQAGMAEFDGPVRVLVAGNDRTGQTFRSNWPDSPILDCPKAGHSFSEPHARDWLFDQLVAALEE